MLGWSIAEGTATAGVDYTADDSGTVTVKMGSKFTPFTVGTLDDLLAESDETFTLTLVASGALPAGVSLGTTTATVTIEDDDAIKASVAAVAPSVTEGGVAEFTVTLTGATSTADVMVSYTLGGTATAGTDYTMPDPLTIAAGDATGTISIRTLDDGVPDPGETLTVTLSGATTMAGTVTVDSAVAATITITDTSPAADPVTVSVAPVALTVDEGGGAVVFTVTLSGAAASDVVLEWRTADGTATAGADYTAVASGTLTVTTGSLIETFSVGILDDLLAESDETFTVTLAASGPGLPAGVSLGASTATVTITDDDRLVASVAAFAGTVTEGMPAEFTVTLTGATSTADVVVSYALGGTATPGDDYTVPAPGTLTLRAGAATGTISIPTRTDGVLDPGETLTVTLDGAGTAAGSVTVDSTAATTTITDPGMVTVSVAAGSAAEGEAVELTVTLSGAVASRVALEWSTADETATTGEDYTAVSDGTVTFVASGPLTRTISVPTLDDEVAEGDEEFTVTLNAAPGFVLPAGVSLGTATAIGTIEDDDEPGILLSIATLTVHEGEMGTWQVALASEPTATTTIAVSSPNSDVTVVDPEDETRRTRTRTLTFTPANWDTYQPVTVDVADDEDVEADVTVNLSHTASGADEYASLMTATVEMTIPGFEVDGKTVTLLVPEERLVTAPSGVRVYLPVAVATTTMVSIREIAVGELPPADPPPGFREGNVAVDIKLDGGAPLPSGTTATVCFPKTGNDLERPRVWRYDASATPPQWVELPEPAGRAPADLADLVCGETEHFSLFAVGSLASRPEVSDRRASVAKAWLVRSGRMIAQHVLDGLQERLRAPREAGFEGALAGRVLDTSGAGLRAGRLPTRAGAREDEWRDARHEPARSDAAVTLRDLVTGSAFRVGAGSEETGFGEVWGRGAHSFVGGTEADVRLDGEVTTGTVGADYRRGRWTGGAALSHSEAEADYRSDAGEGRVAVSVTGLYPYAGFEVTDRVSVWGAGGYGEGGLQVKPDEGERAKADLRLTMVAAGLRGTLVERPDGLEAAAKADVLQVRTTSTETAELEAAEGRVRRVRVGLEGAKPFALDNGASVTPELELGVRHDAGDAETGFGLDLGAGLKWSAPGLRLSGNVGVRGLLVHEDEDLEEWTVSGSVRHAPATPSGRGLSYSLTQSWGAPGTGGGADRLWARETMSGLGAAGGGDSRGRLEAQAGYGFPVLGGRFTGTPHVGLGVSESGRDYRFGYRLDLAGGEEEARFGLGIEARVPDGAGRGARTPAPDLRLTGTVRW